jgi:hypothetical protein
MKKGKFVGISLIGILIAFSFVNTTTAAPPSYVGVSTGNTYNWIASVDMASANATAISLVGAENWTLTYNIINDMLKNETGMEIPMILGAALRVEIINVTDEVSLSLPPPHPAFPASGIMYNLSTALEPNVWSPPLPMVNIILDPVNMNNSNFMYFLFSGGPPLFIPKGVNYNQVATWANTALAGYPPIYNNITFSGLPDGFQITILAEYLEWGINQSLNGSSLPFPMPAFSNVICTVRWNANGVLSLASASYMGLTLVSFVLIDEGEIPGFAIPVFLGVSATTIIGIIYTIKRKRLK